MEGGLGFRTKHSMWSHFMWNKYCKKCRPQIVEWKGGSQTWKYMLQARDSIDQEIWWQPNNDQEENSQLMIQGKWNEELLRHILLEGVADHIIKNIDIVQECEEMHKPYWMLNHSEIDQTKNSCWRTLGQDEAR
ncbi:hypothetical protein KY290_017323 [Solanum tuberosum]|uniref:Uncharacterized protein n=1 Tax=Solanum tuberosum TaxID=4113 RepID=A0ABQ7VAZ5_SOLTU|nr:hypothetical protein KY284_016340 [Solanum tuberosum]KAH0702068.1 hypothetical protein KY285_016346 [Solanum tuberosum]KAH0761250.1 hypothetical protein KY290_017323 [Solanum tuberosum]